ncbi:unnamed protein product [Rotaria sp. Silwood2]|nr:unnamed protein product [Rotaria sp. Silwood2]CAF4235275.1 unnamed protein product [Rotaria sp. Silwood2]
MDFYQDRVDIITVYIEEVHVLDEYNNEKWRSRRRLITPSFHDTNLLHSFMLIFNEQAIILVRNLDKLAQSEQASKTHDLYPYISACTLDIIAGNFR